MIEKVFPASDEAFKDVMAFVESELENADVPMKISMQITIAVEEIYVNIAHYAYPNGDGMMTLGIDANAKQVAIVFTDSGLPFNPLEKEDPDITLGAEQRSIGGLGIFIVKKSMDSVTYVREDDKNILTITKTIA